MKLTDFTNLYSLSKTLRFELIPQGKTLQHIHEKRLIEQDKQRDIDYKKLKKIIDEYHKQFIDQSLKGIVLNDLDSYRTLYQKKEKDDQEKKNFDKVKSLLRKQISDAFKSQEKFKTLFAKELIKDDLLKFVQEEEKELVNEFKDFTTYFTGFHENRKNMYVADEKATSIAFRLINDNLPKFIDNLNIFEQIQKENSNIIENFRTALLEMEDMTQGLELEELFSLNYFNETLSQRGIELYNTMVGGRFVEEGKDKIKGLNEYVNLYNQQQSDRKKRLPKFKQLYKQILSDRNSTSFVIDQFQNDSELLECIEQFYQSGICNYESDGNTINVLLSLQNSLRSLITFDLSRIYLRNDRSITDISQSVFGDWNVIRSALSDYYESTFPINAKEKIAEYEDRKEKWLSKSGYFNISTIQTALNGYKNDNITIKDRGNELINYLASCGFDLESNLNLVEKISKSYADIRDLLNQPYPDQENLKNDKKNIGLIKQFLDGLMDFIHFIKPLNVNEEGLEKDQTFYSLFEPLFDQLSKTISLYNKVRNYLTQKPYSIEKIKLNFENKGQFLGGWVDSKTEDSDNGTQAGGYLFRKRNEIGEYDYYLGMSNDVKLLRTYLKHRIQEKDKSDYERMDYYQLKTASIYGNSYMGNLSYKEDKERLISAIVNYLKKNGEETAFLAINDYLNNNKLTESRTPSGCLNILSKDYQHTFKRIIKDESFLKVNNEVVQNLKETLKTLVRVPKGMEYANKQYTLFPEVIADIEELSKIKLFLYFPVCQKELDDALIRTHKPLFLFKIVNKDLSFAEEFIKGKRKSRGKDNMHTLYFKQLMSGAQDIIDIGTGEVFYREASIEGNITHPAHQAINSKNPLKKGEKRTFKYDIIKDKRFATDKYFLHLSITLNYQKPKQAKDYELIVKKYLRNNPDIKIIGIDRGERHLIYLTLIDQQGNIIKQESLNIIEDKKHNINTPYHTLLSEKEKGRADARVSWNTIESIKELKEGYLSQAVHKMATMMVKHNAIVVMEDLNFGFKRGRFKVEKQIYQKLEKMLIDKLNYLVFKDIEPTAPGGLSNALQLANKFKSFEKINEQSGFLFYVPAWNTSKIDPATGFVDFLKPKYGKYFNAY